MHPVDLPDPVSAVRFRMGQAEMLDKDLVPYIGSASKVSEVMSGKRRFSLSMIRRLVSGLRIPAEVFLKAPDSKIGDAEGAWSRRDPVGVQLKK